MPSGGNAGINQNTAAIKIYSVPVNSTYFTDATMKIMLNPVNEIRFMNDLITDAGVTIPEGTTLFTLPTLLRPWYIKGLQLTISNRTTSQYSIIPYNISTTGNVNTRSQIVAPLGQTIRLYFDGTGFNNSSKYYH